MINFNKSFFFKSHIQFNKKQWSKFINSMPLILTKNEIIKEKKINKKFFNTEISETYILISRLLNFYINFNTKKQKMFKKIIGINNKKNIPYVIGITGSVSVGKSTIAKILQLILRKWPKKRTVELVTTDGFLYSNKILKKKNIMNKKGFPESYDIINLIKFISKIKSGTKKIIVPKYSHLIHDVIKNEKKTIFSPNILILEGLNILQNYNNYNVKNYYMCISDFIDFSIYIDAPKDIIRNWYIKRFFRFRKKSFSFFNSYYKNYLKYSENKLMNLACQLWDKVNSKNLEENILPTKYRANLILEKNYNHNIKKIFFRK